MKNLFSLLDISDIERFKSHFIQNSITKCWNWKKGLDNKGYGKFSINGESIGAHRVSYFIHYKINPLNKCVCHHCDNPKCVNPKHLFLGTKTDNIKDRDKKDRQAFGDRSGARTHPECLKYGDEHWTHKHPEWLYRGDSHWTHKYPDKLLRGDKHPLHIHPELAIRGEKHGMSKLTNKNVIKIRKQYCLGKFGYTKLAKLFNVSRQLIKNVIKRKIWKHI